MSKIAAKTIILISARAEWRAVCDAFLNAKQQSSPFGTWFQQTLTVAGQKESVIFFHGGWGKIPAAASTQYVIDRWSPTLLVNLGTCGGFEGLVEQGTIILVERTVVYDIIEQMGDAAAAIEHFSTDLDLSWLTEPYPMPVRRTLLVSGDRDLVPGELAALNQRYGAVVGDWESGAIAFVAAVNQTRLLILRGVSDLVGAEDGEVYGNMTLFETRMRDIMKTLLNSLPLWLEKIERP